MVRQQDSVEAVAPCPDCRSREGAQKLLQRAEVPPRYFEKGFDVYAATHRLQEKALRRAIDYVEAFPNVPRGLLFIGPCGVGKTHLSVAILKALVQEKLVTAKFVDETELLRKLQYSYGPDSTETEREVILPLLEVDLLVWDDLGTGRPTEWVRETIRMIINHRYTYDKQTILSSNLKLDTDPGDARGGLSRDQSLSERIGQRLFSRIMEMCEVVEIGGPDARTEIHKAGMDFKKSAQEDKSGVPAGLLACPKCASRKIAQLDVSDRPRSEKGRFIEISCLCRGCNEHFLTRFFPRTARVEYPSALD